MVRRLPQFNLQLLLLWTTIAACLFAVLGRELILLLIFTPFVLVIIGIIYYLDRLHVERNVESAIRSFVDDRKLTATRTESKSAAKVALTTWSSLGEKSPDDGLKNRVGVLADSISASPIGFSPAQSEELAEQISQVLEED